MSFIAPKTANQTTIRRVQAGWQTETTVPAATGKMPRDPIYLQENLP